MNDDLTFPRPGTYLDVHRDPNGGEPENRAPEVTRRGRNTKRHPVVDGARHAGKFHPTHAQIHDNVHPNVMTEDLEGEAKLSVRPTPVIPRRCRITRLVGLYLAIIAGIFSLGKETYGNSVSLTSDKNVYLPGETIRWTATVYSYPSPPYLSTFFLIGPSSIVNPSSGSGTPNYDDLAIHTFECVASEGASVSCLVFATWNAGTFFASAIVTVLQAPKVTKVTVKDGLFTPFETYLKKWAPNTTDHETPITDPIWEQPLQSASPTKDEPAAWEIAADI